MKHYVIYVPGIHDDVFRVQSLLLQTWRIYGIRAICLPMPWAGSGDYQPKIQRLQTLINKCQERGNRVSLVGASAGASAVLNVFIEQPKKIYSVGLICPKINNPENVSGQTYGTNPSFKTSLIKLQANLRKLTPELNAKIVSFISPIDRTVPNKDSYIPGIRQISLPNLRHGRAILYCLSLGAKNLLSEIRADSRPVH